MQDIIAYEGVTTAPSDQAKVSFQGCYIHVLRVSALYASLPLFDVTNERAGF